MSKKNKKPQKPDWMPPSMYEHCTIKFSYKLTNCPGCDQEFQIPMKVHQHSYEYVVHVVEECAKYKELNLITECKECHFKFPTQHGYHLHESLVHSTKPGWMPASIFKRRNQKCPTVSVSCPGCGCELKRRKTGTYLMSDYIHMIEECEGYKKLGRIKTCNKCDCKFINSISFSKHKC